MEHCPHGADERELQSGADRFVTSAPSKEKLRPFLMGGNVEKTMQAPATAIIGQDMAFYDKLPELFPHEDARSWFAGK